MPSDLERWADEVGPGMSTAGWSHAFSPMSDTQATVLAVGMFGVDEFTRLGSDAQAMLAALRAHALKVWEELDDLDRRVLTNDIDGWGAAVGAAIEALGELYDRRKGRPTPYGSAVLRAGREARDA